MMSWFDLTSPKMLQDVMHAFITTSLQTQPPPNHPLSPQPLKTRS